MSEPNWQLSFEAACDEITQLRIENAELREARRNIEARLTAELREAAGKYMAVVESGRQAIERLGWDIVERDQEIERLRARCKTNLLPEVRAMLEGK